LDIWKTLNNVDGVVSILRDIRTIIENEFKIIYNETNEITNTWEITIT